MTFNDRMQSLRDRWERLSQRERTMVGAMGVTFIILVVMIVGFLITDGLSSMDERNADMRQALRDLDTQRESYLRIKAKASQMETRLGSSPVALGGYLESAAKDAGVQIQEQTDRPAAAAGKKFIERTADLHLRAVTLEQLTHFLKAIETGKSLVVVTQLNVRTRDDKHEQLDVEMAVATYERASDAGKTGVKKDKP
jgi:type II secretory pathway component PulM